LVQRIQRARHQAASALVVFIYPLMGLVGGIDQGLAVAQALVFGIELGPLIGLRR
jgi:hypothetical protein